MDEPLTKATDVPKNPLPVEESRAQRLQRQQARFRDRGGIFVPSSRNTLIDILLGRKPVQSPKRARTRSQSRSPVKARVEKALGVSRNSTNSSSARKASSSKATRLHHGKEPGGGLPAAGPSRLHSPEPKKAAKKPTKKAATARKGKVITGKLSELYPLSPPPLTQNKDEPQKPAPKRRGRPPKDKNAAVHTTKAVAGEPDTLHRPKPKRATKTSTKRTTKQSSKVEAANTAEYDRPVSGTLEEHFTDGVDVEDTRRKSKGKQTITKSAASITKSAPKPKTKKGSNPDDSVPEQAEKKSRRAVSTKRIGAYIEPSEDGEDKLPMSSRQACDDHSEPSHKNGKRADKKAKYVASSPIAARHLTGDLNNDLVTTSKKRHRLSDVRTEETGVQPSPKRPKNIPDAAQTRPQQIADRDISKHSHASEEEDMPTLEKMPSTSKKRLREPGHEDMLEETVPVAQAARKRVKTNAPIHETTEQPSEDTKKGGRGKAQREPKIKKTLNGDAPVPPKASLQKVAKIPTTPPPKFKLQGPTKSVLKRVRKPLPQIEDDDPDPIDFLS